MNTRGDVIILHISDLHRTPGDSVSNTDLQYSLQQDLMYGFGDTNQTLRPGEPLLPQISEIDLIVVSGDLTQQATANEFRQAEEFLNFLVQKVLRGDSCRLIIVPGNHDINWSYSKGAYEPASPTPELVKSARRHDSLFRIQMDDGSLTSTLLKRANEEMYDERLKGFAESFNRFYNEAYTFSVKDRTEQFTIFDKFTSELGVVIVGFSSCDLVDHLWRRGTIHTEAIRKAASDLDSRGHLINGPLRVAVWHHNILGNPDQQDFMDPQTAVLLAQHGFALGLHGHVHEAGRLELPGYYSQLPVVWAGSLCAGSRERPPAIPLLYNVLGLNTGERRGWVHVRARPNTKNNWSAYRAWNVEQRCWYPITCDVRTSDFRSIVEVGSDIQMYQDISDFGFVGKIQALVEMSREITFVGTGLNVLQGRLLDVIVKRAGEGKLRATFCFGNPFSPYVRDRLVEEERAATPPDVAAAGIVNRVDALLRRLRGVEGIVVKLFNNYPTMSVFRFDDQYVSYPMGYRKLGNQCPVLHSRQPNMYARFLEEMMVNYLEDAIDAAEVFRIKVRHNRDTNFLHPKDIRAVAVYAIPDRTSEFYRVGAELQGYDIYTGSQPSNVSEDRDVVHFRNFVGEARRYGFHLTVADVMYLHRNQIAALKCEMQEIAKVSHKFMLQVDELAIGKFGAHSFILLCSEPSGELERLQGEVTVRIRPLALGTNYTLNPDNAGRLQGLTSRDERMIGFYQSPFVLNRYQPHFSLATPLTAIPEPDTLRLQHTILNRFAPYLSQEPGGERRAVMIDRLYILEKPLEADYWDTLTDEDVIWLA